MRIEREMGEYEAIEVTLQVFTESEEVLDLIHKLPSVVCDLRAKEIAEQKFLGIISSLSL